MRAKMLKRALLLVPITGLALLAFSAADLNLFPLFEDDGKTRVFWESGPLRTAGRLEEKTRQGTWDSFYPNGNQSELGQYRDGNRVGTWTFWKEDGALDRLENYPSPGFLQPVGFPLADIGDLRESEGWQTLAFGAAYCLEYAYNHPQEKQAYLDQGLEWIAASIQRDDNFYNNLLQARLYEQRNYEKAREAALKAQEIGMRTLPNYNQLPAGKLLNNMLMDTGC